MRKMMLCVIALWVIAGSLPWLAYLKLEHAISALPTMAHLEFVLFISNATTVLVFAGLLIYTQRPINLEG